jgi:hypothetical protein
VNIIADMAIDPTYRAKAQEFLTASKKWHSEIGSCEIELMFLQRMLDIYGLKADDAAQTNAVRSLRLRMTTLVKEDALRLKQHLYDHEHHLAQIVEDRLLLQDRELPYRHVELERSVQDFRITYQNLHQAAFVLIEELKMG